MDNKKISRQRNYRRNKDIVYSSGFTKPNGMIIHYLYDTTENPLFTLNEINGNLYYTQDLTTTPSQMFSNGVVNINVVPYSFIRIDANDELYLIADVPNIIDDTFFEINQESGDFIITI